MVYNAIWHASSSYPYIYSYQVSIKCTKALPRYGSGQKSARRTERRTDNAKTISLRQWRRIIITTVLYATQIKIYVKTSDVFVKHYVPFWALLTYLFDLWPGMVTLTFFHSKLQLHEIHMHAKYQVAIFIIAIIVMAKC